MKWIFWSINMPFLIRIYGEIFQVKFDEMKITSLHSYPFITWRIDNAVTSERSVTLLKP